MWNQNINGSKLQNLLRSMLAAAAAKSHQSCPTLSDPMDCSLPGLRVQLKSDHFKTCVLRPCCCCCLVAKSCLTLQLHELQLSRFFCLRDFLGKNTRVGCHVLLQGIFLTQGSNLYLPHWHAASLPLSHLEAHPGNLANSKFLKTT